MKINFKTKERLQRSIGRAAAVLGLIVLGASAAHAQTPPASPVGVWDCNITGSRSGLALMEFFVDGTFVIEEIVVPAPPRSPSSPAESTGRGTGGGRNGTGGSGGTNFTILSTNLFGHEITTGRWGYDSRGNLIGFYSEILAGVCTTNVVTVTNSDGSVTNVETKVCKDFTNAVSFTGKTVPGTRLTLHCTLDAKKALYSGRPAILLTNIAGKWYGNRLDHGFPTTEFLTLTDAGGNVYPVAGESGNYQYTGVAMLSRWNKIAYDVRMLPEREIVRAVVGGFDKRRIRANTKGVEQTAGSLNRRIVFQATRSAVPPPTN